MREELAYVAGLLDGEGYIGIARMARDQYKHGVNYTPMVKLVSTHEPLVSYLIERFGGNRSHRVFPSHRNSRDAFEWGIRSRRRVLPFLKQIRPWLRVKADAADVVIGLCESMGRWGCNGMSDEEFQRRTRLWEDLRRLNHRGRPPAETEREDTLHTAG